MQVAGPPEALATLEEPKRLAWRGLVIMVIVERDANMWYRSGKWRGVKPRSEIRAVRSAWWLAWSEYNILMYAIKVN